MLCFPHSHAHAHAHAHAINDHAQAHTHAHAYAIHAHAINDHAQAHAHAHAYTIHAQAINDHAQAHAHAINDHAQAHAHGLLSIFVSLNPDNQHESLSLSLCLLASSAHALLTHGPEHPALPILRRPHFLKHRPDPPPFRRSDLNHWYDQVIRWRLLLVATVHSGNSCTLHNDLWGA